MPRYSGDQDSCSLDIEYIAQRNSNLMQQPHHNNHASDTDCSSGGASSEIMRMFLRNHRGQPPQHAKQLVDFSCNHLTHTQAQRIIDDFYRSRPYDAESRPSAELLSERRERRRQRHAGFTTVCGKQATRSDVCVFVVWFLMMAATLFGLSFGLIHIGNGVIMLRASARVTVEVCVIEDFMRIECDGGFRFDYMVRASDKCPDRTLQRRVDEIYMDECGMRGYEVGMSLNCYVADCEHNEYSLVGFGHLEDAAQSEIEIGCIVLFITVVPFIFFLLWVYFVYSCGPK